MLHYYFGEGKGKTSAAVGLVIRAVGRGKSFLVAHFFKEGIKDSGEDIILKNLKKGFVIHLPSNQWIDFEKLSDEDIARIKGFYKRVVHLIKEKDPDIVVLDEIVYALEHDLIERNAFIQWLEKEKQNREIILTGRPKLDEIIQVSDYVSEIKGEKHPYDTGGEAREGIEF